MVSGPAAKATHRYFPTYAYFMERCQQAGYSLGKMVDLHPELRNRFTENGRRTQLLKRFHGLYRWFTSASEPVYQAMERWERTRGSGPVSRLLDQHYYWAIRYHFFLGFTNYNRNAAQRPAIEQVRGRKPIPTLAIERHD